MISFTSNAETERRPNCQECNQAIDRLDKTVVYKLVGLGPEGKWESFEFSTETTMFEKHAW